MLRQELYFSGLVQGVGFRDNTGTVAQEFDVCGSVQNLADGRVRLIVEGQPVELKRFVERISRHGNVTDVEVFELETTSPPLQGFRIIR